MNSKKNKTPLWILGLLFLIMTFFMFLMSNLILLAKSIK